jgi:hypothetical protein
MPYPFKEKRSQFVGENALLDDIWTYWNPLFGTEINDGYCPICDTAVEGNLFCLRCRDDYNKWLNVQPSKLKSIVGYMKYVWDRVERRETLDKWLAGG